VRATLLAAVAALGLAACGSSGKSSLADRCTDRIVRESAPVHAPVTKSQVRRYITVTYCDRFAQKGWVYADGALSIDAQRWLDEGSRESCATAGLNGETKTTETKTTPCPAIVGSRTIDCALLRFVRRSEVRTYLARLQRRGSVLCDNGTPLTALGVP
jgi:hypothetical protein